MRRRPRTGRPDPTGRRRATNSVLHLLATANDFGVPLSIDDFDRISRLTPVLADLRPWGTYTAPEMYEAGGMAVVGKRLLEAGLLHLDEKTVTGRTIGAEIARAREPADQNVIKPLSQPLKKEGGLAILHGNLAPGGIHRILCAACLIPVFLPGNGIQRQRPGL